MNGLRTGGRTQGSPLLLGFLLSSCFSLAGCGDDRPYSPPSGPPRRAQAAPTVPPPAAAPADSTPSGPADPLLGDAGQAPPDPLIGHDPLQGRAMPTAHSHWLRGRLRDAHVTVLLNGVRHGSFSGVLDQDITMKLRRGVNTVTFVYQPNAASSAADLEIVESEHHPPIAPLVTFRSAPGLAASEGAPKPETKTFPFVAN
jgi:hypothetical protein